MITYIPFLKAKQGELTAMSELASDVKKRICPFLDFPRKKRYDAALFATTTVRIARSLKRHWGVETEFYFDDLDIRDKLTVEGQQQYAFVLGALTGLRVIPVVGLARSMHNAAVADLKRNGEIDSPVVAFRAHPQDFEDFDGQQDEIEDEMGDIFKEFQEIGRDAMWNFVRSSAEPHRAAARLGDRNRVCVGARQLPADPRARCDRDRQTSPKTESGPAQAPPVAA